MSTTKQNYVDFTGAYAAIPDHMQAAIWRYVDKGLEPGDFLKAIITNNLQRAVFSADDVNLPLIPLYVRWFYFYAPGCCHGSKANMDEWMNARSQDALVQP